MFTLAISCLTTSNLPWFMDLTFQIPMLHCSLQHQTLLPSPVTFTTGFFCLFVLFFFWYCFCFGSISSFFLVISPLISSSIWGTYRPGEFIFQCPIFLPFHTVNGALKAKILVCRSLLEWNMFYQNSPPWPVCLGWPYMAWLIVSLNWTRLWSMWLDWLVFCDCGYQFVCPLMEKDKRLMEACWWESLTEGETWSCSDGQSHAQ